ncbi:MAG: 1-acyl-sn-glycerol-3-phosphate acyltransferase [Spirochaetia bacterium]|nr:1-acyl-sn-glycerol-3-phosphate acyltransferase [Spirochaetia bacterium]
MKLLSRFLNGVYRLFTKASLQISYDFQVWQAQELPKGPKIFCSNHFSSSDVHFVTTLSDGPLHMVIGPGFTIKFVRHLLRWMEQIPADTKENRAKVVDRAVTYLDKGENIYIFPEGKLNIMEKMENFKPGIARMYLKKHVPIIPIGLLAPRRRVRHRHSAAAGRNLTIVSRNYYANIGRPMEFPDALETAKTDQKKAEQMILDQLQEEIYRLIDDLKTNKFWS